MTHRALRLRADWPSVTTIIELPVCLLVIGALSLVGVNGFLTTRHRLQGVEAILLAGRPIAAMTEYHAVTGVWPASNEQASYVLTGGESGRRVQTIGIRAGGAADVTFSDLAGALARRRISFRAWQSADAALPIVWRCGRAPAPAGFEAAPDGTTVAASDLPSACRSP